MSSHHARPFQPAVHCMQLMQPTRLLPPHDPPHHLLLLALQACRGHFLSDCRHLSPAVRPVLQRVCRAVSLCRWGVLSVAVWDSSFELVSVQVAVHQVVQLLSPSSLGREQ